MWSCCPVHGPARLLGLLLGGALAPCCHSSGQPSPSSSPSFSACSHCHLSHDVVDSEQAVKEVEGQVKGQVGENKVTGAKQQHANS